MPSFARLAIILPGALSLSSWLPTISHLELYNDSSCSYRLISCVILLSCLLDLFLSLRVVLNGAAGLNGLTTLLAAMTGVKVLYSQACFV